jgi:hypothetical protein
MRAPTHALGNERLRLVCPLVLSCVLVAVVGLGACDGHQRRLVPSVIGPDCQLVSGAGAADSTDVRDSAADIHQSWSSDSLRGILLAMVREDQHVREELETSGELREMLAHQGDTAFQHHLHRDDTWTHRMNTIDSVNQGQLGLIIDRFGWPGYRVVGRRGAHAAWLLIQHADTGEQNAGLRRMESVANDVSPADLANLEDRVRIRQGKPQSYGTQFQGNQGSDRKTVPLALSPLLDPGHVDDRRKSVGLPSMAANACRLAHETHMKINVSAWAAPGAPGASTASH